MVKQHSPGGVELPDMEDALDRFEQVWRRGGRPQIAEYLPPPGSPGVDPESRHSLLREMVMIDLWYRWRQAGESAVPLPPPPAAGEAPRESEKPDGPLPDRPYLEDYVRRYPEMGSSEEIPLEVIGEEYRARKRWGDRPSHDVYLARFTPREIEVQRALSDVDMELAAETVSIAQAPPAQMTTTLKPRPAELAAKEEPPVPEMIGKYRIIDVFGKGGQAQVFRAVHPTLAKELVIKLGRVAVLGDDLPRQRMIDEGKVLADLDHPNLARIYDLDFHEDRPFLVMEFVRGRTLRQQMRVSRPAPRDAARLMAQVARAMVVAHRRGVIHQDLKPENIVLDESGRPRVIDFGLARMQHAWADTPAEHGSISGTVQYMAPEQARGETERVDQRTDVFAMGAVLYDLLGGQAPFTEKDIYVALERARRCDFDATALHKPGIPRMLEKICLKAMQAEPENRYASAEQMAADLERVAAGPSRWKKALAAGLLVVAAAIAAFVLAGRHPSPVEPVGPVGPVAVYPERPLRHDFQFKCQLLGQAEDADKIALTEGQQIALRLQSERDCYVGVWHVDDQGTVTQLFPNKYENDHFVKADQPRTVPGKYDYEILATAAKGPEFLHVIAATQRWETPVGRQLGPYVVFATPQERARWEEQLKGMTLAEGRPFDIAERVLQLRVSPAPFAEPAEN